MLTYTPERKLEGVRKSLAFVKQVTDRVEQATQAQPAQTTTTRAEASGKDRGARQVVAFRGRASTTPALLLQIGYAARARLHAARPIATTTNARSCGWRSTFSTRVRLARVMRDINERVGNYLFALAVIYSLVAIASTIVLALLGLPRIRSCGAC